MRDSLLTTDKVSQDVRLRAETPSLAAQFAQETFALLRRLLIQLSRRPSFFVGSLIQPLMFLVLFSALFAQVPRGLFGTGDSYTEFLAAGVIVFTAFGSALNAGLPLVFDREFGFLNRLLVAPLASRLSIVFASVLFIVGTSLVQTLVIGLASLAMGAHFAGGLEALPLVVLTVALLVLGFGALSIGLAFALPGHIEMLAAVFVLNLPLVFSSTALAPLHFMPDWLRLVASLNPLTYAIEPIRYLFATSQWSLTAPVIAAPFAQMSIPGCLLVLAAFDTLAVGLVALILKKKLA